MYYENKLSRRFVAFFIDIFLLSMLSTFLISLGLGEDIELIFGITTRSLTFWQETLLYTIYFVGFVLFNNGVTIGKSVMKLSIKGKEFGELSQNRMIVREVVKVFLLPISFISFIVCLLRPDNKSLHDMIMNTYVVRKTEKFSNPYNVRPELKETYDLRKEDLLGSDYYDDPAEKDTFDDFENRE